MLLAGLLVTIAASAFPLKIKGIDTTRTAILVHDLRWGIDLVKENADRPLVPASVTKTVTTASLLNLAEGSERFATPVVAEGEIKDSVLIGDVIVRVCGDPTIESSYFEDSRGFASGIADGLRRLGISTVAGDVIIDESGFPDATTPPGWMAEDIVWPYGARLHGANFRDNRFRLRLPSKDTAPRVPDLKFSFSNPSRRGVNVDRKDGSETMLVSGNIRRGFSDTFSTPVPSKVMKAEIIDTLRRHGIGVKGEKTPEARVSRTVYTHLSPTFAEIMKSLMFRSDNLMAEGMLRTISPGGTRSDALSEEMAVWTMAGIVGNGVKIVDGSGLSRDNRLTARFLGDINSFMLRDEFGQEYTSLFPRAGYDGTMKNFLTDTPLEGRVAMKTGSMKGVQSYSGYLLDDEGRPTHVIVFIANGFTCPRQTLKNAFQRLLLELFDVSLQGN